MNFRLLAERVLQTVLTLWAVATVLFLMFRLLPGDPTLNYIDTGFTEDQRQALLRQFGLDRSLFDQYLIYLASLARGKLGVSFVTRTPVLEVVLEVLPNTLALTIGALLLAYLIGILAGAWLAWRRGTVTEAIGIPLALTLRAAPEFWVGMMLLAVFSFSLGWLPAGGANSAGMAYGGTLDRMLSLDFLRHLILPMLALTFYLQGLPLLLMRASTLEVLGEEFITMARLKGLSTRAILFRHAARNALLPVVTAFTLGLGASLGGNVVLETVFSWPGLGRVLVNAVAANDYPLAQGAFLLIAATLVVLNLAADLIYRWLDPRIADGDAR
ncbi:MAG: ABC transporter permease [Alphaproteobacteria bacterium]|nr:ABC transporter permease [Alphaproteobacteria bacterium]